MPSPAAVAHHHELANPDRASFWGDKRVADLLDAAEPDLRERIQSVVGEEKYAGLKFYRNLAAHRGVMGEQQRGGAVEEVGVDGVRFMLPDWLPLEAPDHPSFSIRPIRDRYLAWGRPALAGLNALASVVWEPGVEAEAELVLVDEMLEDPAPPRKVDREPPDPVLGPTREDLAPRVGDWRVWFEWGRHDFGNDSTVPPAWYARHDDDDAEVLNAVDLEIDRLREWLEGLTTQLATKAILWHYRPQQSPTNVGRVLAPRIRR